MLAGSEESSEISAVAVSIILFFRFAWVLEGQKSDCALLNKKKAILILRALFCIIVIFVMYYLVSHISKLQPRISIMYGIGRTSFFFRRRLHTSLCDAPGEMLRKKAADIEQKKKRRDRKKNYAYAVVPPSLKFYDTATPGMYLTGAGLVIFVKLLMMYDESKEEERLERTIEDIPDDVGSMRMLSREEWDEIRERWPRTPFESSFARPNARVRTGESLHMDDYKDWTIDVLTDALTRAEETAVRNSSK